MKIKWFISFLALCLIVSPLLMAQSRDTGAIVGTIVDADGQPLPGVTITVSSPNLQGQRSAITDVEGQYRFPALPPGPYEIRAELEGFGTTVQENIRVTTTVRLVIDLTLRPSTLEEEVTVVAESPTVDVKSTETASVTLSSELLSNLPFSNFSVDIVNLAPGVSSSSAYGASSSTGVSFQMDGVDVSDPEGGTAWVFSDPNIVEEAKIMGVGLPAEYGNFTGVIFNMVTKSGGNEFSGMAQFIYQGTRDDSKFWVGSNSANYIDDFPDITSPSEAVTDFALNLGGPLIRDKLWFFAGGQYYFTQTAVTGFPETVDYKQPRGFAKLTFQASPSTNLSAFFEYDTYTGVNRSAGATVSPEATVGQESPDIVGNFTLTQIVSERTFFDLKGSFFHGYYYLDPETGPETSAHYNLNDNMRYDSAGWFYYADRDRFQANASLTHYAEDFIQGDHDFKFGVEFERSTVRNRYGYTGPNAFYYVDYTGYGPYGYYYTGNYLAYQYEGYDTSTKYSRMEEFVQDSWKVSDRLNISLGLRFTHVWGFVQQVDGSVYSNTRIAPRLGFTFDLLGDKTTIFKAHYGQFTEAMLATYHGRLNPPSSYSDSSGYFWDTIGEEWVEFFRDPPAEDKYQIDEGIKHPYMDQFTAGIERELFKDTSISATFIYRNWHQPVGVVDITGQYDLIDMYVPELNQTFQIYEQTNYGQSRYIVKNFSEGDPWILEKPYRKYTGLELLFNKRFSNNWQLLASYVYSVTKSTIDNSSASDTGGWNDTIADPNTWIFAEGRPTYDPTHMLKVQGTYVFPLGINLTAHFHAITGRTWETRYLTPRLAQGRVTFRTEPNGTHHYDMAPVLDMRLEKTFTFAGKYRLGLMFDVFNVFNNDTVTSWGTRIGYDWSPGDYASTDGHELYGLTPARQARLGIRLMF
jgi:carboxypeptidase family protein